MATTGDLTDLRGTQRPKKNLIYQSTHIFKFIIVSDYPCKVCLPPNIQPNNACSIFSLFFNIAVLNILIQNINTYEAQHYTYLKAV